MGPCSALRIRMSVLICMCPTVFLLATQGKKQTKTLVQTSALSSPSLSPIVLPSISLLYSRDPWEPRLSWTQHLCHQSSDTGTQQQSRRVTECCQYSYECHKSEIQKRTGPKGDTVWLLLLKAYYQRE